MFNECRVKPEDEDLSYSDPATHHYNQMLELRPKESRFQVGGVSFPLYDLVNVLGVAIAR
jgi:hypothetical protein